LKILDGKPVLKLLLFLSFFFVVVPLLGYGLGWIINPEGMRKQLTEQGIKEEERKAKKDTAVQMEAKETAIGLEERNKGKSDYERAEVEREMQRENSKKIKESRFVSACGNIYPGMKIYYGEANKVYVGEVMKKGEAFFEGKLKPAVLLRMKSGNLEWKLLRGVPSVCTWGYVLKSDLEGHR